MVNTNSRKPSLNQSRARIARSGEHLESLDDAINLLADGWKHQEILQTSTLDVDVPAIVPILVGEVAYNLKSALDYLAHELFYLANGRRSNSTKFPTERVKESWDKYLHAAKPKDAKKLWLPKLRPKHQAMIQALQPFDSGPQWPSLLADITNGDKHRYLTVTVGKLSSAPREVPAVFTKAIAGVFPEEMFVHRQITATATFEDGTLVVQTLQNLQRQVTDVVDAFDPDFT